MPSGLEVIKLFKDIQIHGKGIFAIWRILIGAKPTQCGKISSLFTEKLLQIVLRKEPWLHI